MIDYRLIVAFIWLVFAVVWIVASASAKKNRTSKSKVWAARAVSVVVVLVFLNLPSSVHIALYHFGSNASSAMAFDIVGTIFVAAGIGLAIWARANLGKNWGMPMSLKENPELVTSGPYEYIRNPIYSGILLAYIGTAFVDGAAFLLVAAIFAVYFVYSSRIEEKIMEKEFPNQYPAYKKRTKMLIPFVF